jgi:hypothetical protein
MADRKLTVTRIQKMLDRQFPPRWGPDYIPAQLATSAEKPSITKASMFHSAKFQRYMHAIASTELPFIALALMHPNLFELKEQWVLSPSPYGHPMVGHPRAAGLLLPSTHGSLTVAIRLGLVKWHPRVLAMKKQGDSPAQWSAGLLLRDILLFLEDEKGPYCVDWDIKKQEGDHGKPGPSQAHRRGSAGRIQSAAAKDKIYLECLGELGIRPVRLAASQLPRHLKNNLCRLAFAHSQVINLPPALHAMALDAFREAIVKAIPPNEVIDDLAERGVSSYEARRVLEQGVWYRQLKIDLFSYWVNDEPMEPERQHPIDVYSDWFKRAS